MNRLRLICLFLVCLLGMALPPARAAERDSVTLGRERLESIFREIICDHLPWPAEELEISGFAARPATLAVPAGTIGYRLVDQLHPKYLGRKSITVVILVNGRQYGKVRMHADLARYGKVVSLTRPVERHTVLTLDDIGLSRRNITMLGSDCLVDPAQVVGKRLKVSLRAGSVLRDYHLEAVPLVHRGDRVTIVARTAGLTVTVPGEARETGACGDLVRVKNMMSRKEVRATVLDRNTVRVDL